ncbi:hypothetical protein RYX56_06565 [Alkalihalophilus lindianensis]|uniref:Uncharacterized protein n=1 Tax=Alkalihalophilus lindianensis TaxID=1630542 RepID=A0ABU3X9P5_9BACI|nr:hypothetical protein [Alkalihalophilus lindianensis]MDV2684033.1 hypothetical protein [Alkalihalophilus lindianensis]
MESLIYQIIAILFPISILFLIAWFISTSLKKSKQLKDIEQKLSRMVKSETKEH